MLYNALMPSGYAQRRQPLFLLVTPRRNAYAEAIVGVIMSPFVTGQNLVVDGGRSLWLSAVR